MANIMINDVCNLRCPYCFANEFVNEKASNKNDMTLENFKKAVDFTVKKDDRIGIIGGEPTLHPKLPAMLDCLINDIRVNNVLLFSNGINLNKVTKYLLNDKFRVLINLNPKSITGEKKHAKILENLDDLYFEYNQKDTIDIGVNVYKKNMDFEFLLNVLKRYKQSSVRVSITIPNKANDKKVIDRHLELKPELITLFKKLDRIGVVPYFDCARIPACILDEKEKIFFNNLQNQKQNVRKNLLTLGKCQPIVDILPTLEAVRCFGTSRALKLHIKDFKDTNELRRRFEVEFDNFVYQIPSTEECIDCQYRTNGDCMGGCLAYKSDKIKKVKDMISGEFL